MTKPPSLLDAALESEGSGAREAALKAARDLGISNDDPVWLVVQAIREADHALLDRIEKLELQLGETTDKLRVIEERRTLTTVGYETLEARIATVLEDVRAMADEQWDRFHAGLEHVKQMQRWQVGVFILAIALWAMATPIGPSQRESVSTVGEAVQSDE